MSMHIAYARKIEEDQNDNKIRIDIFPSKSMFDCCDMASSQFVERRRKVSEQELFWCRELKKKIEFQSLETIQLK